MPKLLVVREEIQVDAPIERCFQLSTQVEIVQEILGMRPVRGRTSGRVRQGDTVRWQGWQLGLPQMHESLIDACDPPHFFRDSMIAGRFAEFQHDHRFLQSHQGRVLMQDEVRFAMPWAGLGAVIGRLILAPHIRRLMRKRFAHLKQLAEGDGWRSYLLSSREA